ncbi:MAG: 3-deoxy-D-manno-octulosonate 8-phosphate phosphatase [Flavobacterium sp. BFFFF2]|nr:MAG: 3-deoxy-D-manno-octulosonate 8-phosphate phosphatase [Flavobacterium sp. BFFFF2]
MAENYKTKLQKVRAFVFDVDGVLTDGTVLVTDEGQLLRSMHIRDGFALKAATEKGYPILILSGGFNDGVRIRLHNLGIKHIILGSKDKVADFHTFCIEQQIDPQSVAYMGDDIPDYQVMKMTGLASCPQDAIPEIKKISHYISHRNGGRGAVRDLIEQVLKVQGNWDVEADGAFF